MNCKTYLHHIETAAMILKIVLVIFIYTVIQIINANKRNVMSGFIVGGFYSTIESFPYAVYISKNCSQRRNSSCGASILNQVILLTAAHCFKKCDDFTVNAYAGSIRKYHGFENKVISLKIHERYNRTSFENDIALLRLETELTFRRSVKKIILLKFPPNDTVATVAGWGWVDSKGTRGDVLKHTSQQLIDREECVTRLGQLPDGTICGRDISGESYPEKGDSGSPLVINGTIQIGIVSFKRRKFTNDTIVYTNVSYFYDWIVENAKIMYCAHKNVSLLKAFSMTDFSREHCALAKDIV